VADGVFGVEVVTPEEALVTGPATAVMLRTSTGEMTVLDGHTALVGDVVSGLVRVENPDGTTQRLAVHGGFIQVDTQPGAADDLIETSEGGPLAGMSTRVTLLAGVAERAEDIDVDRAQQAQEACTQLVADLQAGRGPVGDLEDEGGTLDLSQAEQALARAELRLSVAAGSA
jgi:F-type H+-transporting ATPase subunit epsilon